MLSAYLHRRRTVNAHAPETKSTSPLIALSLNGNPRWGGRDFASLAKAGVMGNAIVYACVRRIAEAAASVPFTLYQGDSEIETHPLKSLLARPNPQEDGTELFIRWYAFLMSAGNAYLEAVSGGDAIRELYVLRPDRMKVVADSRGWPIAYDYTVDGRTMRIARELTCGFLPVLHGKLFHPLDDQYGLSPSAAAAAAVEVHNAGAGWTKSLLDNAARPSGALIYQGPDGASNLTDDQFQRLKRELEDTYQGSQNAGRPMVLEGGLDWRSMSFAPSEMDFSGIRDAAAREIALAFGIPSMLLGIPGDNTYSNYREANLAFWRQTVLPLVSRTADSLTMWLAPRFGENVRIFYDTDRVDALVSEREALWAGIDAASFLTLNEKRACAGYSPVAEGDRMA